MGLGFQAGLQELVGETSVPFLIPTAPCSPDGILPACSGGPTGGTLQRTSPACHPNAVVGTGKGTWDSLPRHLGGDRPEGHGAGHQPQRHAQVGRWMVNFAPA